MKKILQLFISAVMLVAIALSGAVAMADDVYYKTVCQRNEMTADEVQLCTVTVNKTNEGYITVRKATSDAQTHGNIYAIGTDVAGTMPYLRPEMQTKLSDILHVDFEFYVSKGGGIRWEHRNATNLTAMHVSGSTLTVGAQGKPGDAKSYTEFKSETWYKAKYTFDFANHDMDFYLYNMDDELVWSAESVLFPENNTVSSLAHFRIHYEGAVPGFYEFDNFHEYFEAQAPVVMSAAGVDSSAEAEYNASGIEFQLSGKVYAESVNTDSVELLCGSDSVVLSDVSFNSELNTITVIPKYYLDPNTSYSLVLNDKFEVFEGVGLNNNITEDFVTRRADIQLESHSFVAEGSNLTFAGILSNNTDKSDEVFVIMNIWQGNKLKSISLESVLTQAGADDNEFSVSVQNVPASCTAEVIILSDLEKYTRCGNVKYTFEK